MRDNIVTTNSKRIILILFILSFLLSVTANTSLYPIVWNINSVGMMISICLLPSLALRINDFDSCTNRIIVCIMLMSLFQTIRSILFPDLQIKGNLYFTLFGNPFCTLSLIISIFIYLCKSGHTLLYLKKYTIFFVFIGVLVYFLLNKKFSFSLWTVTAFFPFYKKKFRFLLILMYLIVFYEAVFAEETSRTNIVTLGICAMTLICYYFNISKKLINLFCYGMIIIPVAYFIVTLIDPTFSVIELIMENISNNVDETMDTTDTRTFLFVEMIEDLTKNNSWLLGKGARSGYFSLTFQNSTSGLGDHWYRITPEISGLHYLLRGGIMFCVFHYGLIVYAVHKALMYGRNKFVQTIAILASGWIFISCFSFLHGFSIVIVGFYILLGCCLSEKWLNKTDKEIDKLFI